MRALQYAALAGLGLLAAGGAVAGGPVEPTAGGDALDITDQAVRYEQRLDALIFEQELAGDAGGIQPQAAGQLDGAPVLGYVFPTTLSPTAVGFGDVDGTLALAATAHPDFDDTPLFDEDGDGDYDDDGRIWHAHWVVLGKDERTPGGLSVVEFEEGDDASLPPTSPGMSIYLDSPGFGIATDGDTLRVTVPAYRVRDETSFRFDAVTAYMEVNTSDDSRPMLGVYEVYDVASGDLSLPYQVSGGQ
jgi:hypothetical protein